MSSKNGGGNNMDRPLQGTVLCCTSIPPEQRTRMAETAVQMGAEHKLDLTSDVTHLIVGASNTPKYKYVAREREDIKVLQLQWVEAVRQAWMQGDDVNLGALEEEYRLPAFAGLRICVTGFEDLTFRAQLQEAVSANGGEYRGDLTKEVTHLIAYAPEGKKYQYATQWEINIVGLPWLKDCLDRRMILEESLYHPSLPKDKLGVGAWKRRAAAETQPGKRACDEETVPDKPQKLRRTTSAKLGSQTEGIWGEIVGAVQGEQLAKNDQPRPSRPLPVLKAAVLEPKSFGTDSAGTDDASRKQATEDLGTSGLQPVRSGIFAGISFALYAFTQKQTSILREHILSNDGEILAFPTDSDSIAISKTGRLFLIVPHCHPSSDIPQLAHFNSQTEIVTDMWAERCLQSKRFLEPHEHVLSRPIRVFPIPGFEKLIINSTGLPNIELLHVSKIVELLGAKYDQVLKPDISVLLCYPGAAGEDKLRHASKWYIPAVSLQWLWSCISLGELQSFGTYLLDQGHTPENVIFDPSALIPARKSIAKQNEDEKHVATSQQRIEPIHPPKNATRNDSPTTYAADSKQMLRAPTANSVREEEFLKSPQRKNHANELRRSKWPVSIDLAANEDRDEPDGDEEEGSGIGLPLQEVSANSPSKSETASSPRNAHLPNHFCGQSILPHETENNDTPSASEATSARKTAYVPPQPDPIKGAIKELLGKNKAKNMTSAMPNGEIKKKRLLGRALSNMSNSSREASNIRASRASSIDSVNTDGLGSVILDETSQNHIGDTSRRNGRGSFTGRASSGPDRRHKESPLELEDMSLFREEYPEEEEPPPMTQLGYENPADAVALREMLAERRRNRTRTGQEDTKGPDFKEEKKIKDDATVTAAGWGHGRRTRQQAKLR